MAGRRSRSSRRSTRSPRVSPRSRRSTAPRSIGVWKGEAIGFGQQETIARRFAHALGSPNYLSNDSMCYAARYFGFKLVDGAWPVPDLENAGCIVLWGANPPYAHPNMTQYVTAARRKGATLVVVDPRLSAIARRADIHAGVRPGTDGALAWGLIRQLVTAGAYDKDFVERFTVGFAKVVDYAQAFTPEAVEAETGVPAATVRAIARAMESAAPRVAAYVGNGLEHHENGVNNIRAIAMLDGLLGTLDRDGRHLLQGGGAAARPDAVRGRAAEAPRPPRRRPLPGAVRPAPGVSHHDGRGGDPSGRALSPPRHDRHGGEPGLHESQLHESPRGPEVTRPAGGARSVHERDGRRGRLRAAGGLVPRAHRAARSRQASDRERDPQGRLLAGRAGRVRVLARPRRSSGDRRLLPLGGRDGPQPLAARADGAHAGGAGGASRGR